MLLVNAGEIYNISVMYVDCNRNRLQEYVGWCDWNKINIRRVYLWELHI